MKKSRLWLGALVAIVLVIATAPVVGQASGGDAPSTVSYQGQVVLNGSAFNGTGYFKFAVIDSAGLAYWSNDELLGGVEPIGSVPLAVSQGLFSVLLGDTALGMQPLPASAFSGPDRWLRVWFSSDGDAFQLLSPDGRIAAVPYALQASNAGMLEGLEGSAYQLRVSGACGEGYAIRAIAADGTVTCEAVGGPADWSLAGNAGTTPGTHYLGTSDNQALELKVNGQRALRLEPDETSPNLIGGYSGNAVDAGLYGATISGGGREGSECGLGPDGTDPCWNRVTGEGNYATIGGGNANTATYGYATVGGGENNTASGRAATVSGGSENTASGWYATVGGGGSGVGGNNTASGWFATVAGGQANTASAWGATVGGGDNNTASSAAATVGGGSQNTASGNYATVGGGSGNTAQGDYSFAAGRSAKANHIGSFVWADSTLADFPSTAANQFLVHANGGVKVVREASTYAYSSAALEVDHGGTAEAAWFYTANSATTFPVLKVLKRTSATANFIEGADYDGSGGGTPKFHIDQNGTYHAGSDFAEALPVAGDPAAYQPGDVLVISLDRPGGVEKCSQPYDGRVLGVYSSRPGFVGADKGGVTEVAAGEVPVAVLGIVPVKVSAENGPIHPGDLLTTSSTPGHAMRCEGLELCFGRTLGKALEALAPGQLTGVIQMLVTLQ